MGTKTQQPAHARILVPVRYSAWLSGDLGRQLQAMVEAAVPRATVTKLPRGFLVEDDTIKAQTLLSRVHAAVVSMEARTQERYPVFHHEMGPVWSGTLQVVYQT